MNDICSFNFNVKVVIHIFCFILKNGISGFLIRLWTFTLFVLVNEEIQASQFDIFIMFTELFYKIFVVIRYRFQDLNLCFSDVFL